MRAGKLLAITTLCSAFALAGCEVEKTQEGEMPDIDVSGDAGQLPKYDVDVEQTQEGEMPDVDVDVEGGQMPEYDVETPDVDVHMEEETVEVPDVDVDVDTEEKTISVPDVDVDMPEDDEAR